MTPEATPSQLHHQIVVAYFTISLAGPLVGPNIGSTQLDATTGGTTAKKS